MVSREYYEMHNRDLTEVYSQLSDDYSRSVMKSFVEQRISGNYKYSNGFISDINNEYFEQDLFRVHKDIVLIDCGAYDGVDTIRFFKKFENSVFSFVIEPDVNNINLIKENLPNYNDRIQIVNKAIWDSSTTISFSTGGGEGSGFNESGNEKVKTVCIDSLYAEYRDLFDEKDIIVKMDIEGIELKALQGAVNFIKEKHPILSICVYHKQEDIFELPIYIKSIFPDYKLYLRRYDKGFRDTVLYAVP